ncbi:multidrug export protein MepA [Clostridium acetireducens DSM 10703]|uniref:Multidrug export protein MepA n=1 Tax=Clostridium acetireducens DSM 10703 TaxID=1121290 RepID=A0A1E8F1S3_9CLOT|nr:MATE family efflux transporter [Clostridium acetireducens]OFI07111.1 multidrug export protein MepA [Clostridium acetireducens DSM 10703]
MNKNLVLMKEGNISKALINLSLPTIIGLLIISIYNFTDSLFVSGLGTEALGATSIVYPLITLILGIGLLFGNGGSAYISQLLGANKKGKSEKVLASTIFYSVFISLLLEIIILIFLNPILRFIGATDTLLPLAKEYSSILVLSFIFQALSISFMNLVRAEGAVNLSMYSQIGGAILNIILDPIFIYTFKLGIRGAAIATVISQIVSLVILIPYYISGKSYLKISIKNIRVSKEIIKPILVIGLPLFAINLLQCMSISLLNIFTAPYGDEAVAGVGIVTRICSIPMFVVTGFSRGYQNFVAFNFGAKNLFRVRKSTKKSLIWSVGFCILISIVQVVFSKQLVSLFTQDTLVIKIGIRALFANSIVFFTYGYQSIVIVLLLSIQKEREGFFLSLGRQGIFFIPLAFILPKLFGLTGVIYVQAAADILTTLATLYIFFKIKKQKLKY